MKKQLTETVNKKGLEIISLLVAIALWQFASDFIVQNKLFLPSFSDVVVSFFEIIESGDIFADISISLLHFGIGLGSAFVIGLPIGMVMGWFKTANRLADPLIEIIRPIPPLAWIPFAIVWLGLTHISAGFVVFVGAVFPIIINTFTGFKGVSKVHVEAAKVLGCTRDRELIRHVALPSAIPSIAAGIRIGMGVGWMCLVAAEMFGVSESGLGFRIWHYYYLHKMDLVLVHMILLGFLGLMIDAIFRYYIDKRLLKWRAGVVV